MTALLALIIAHSVFPLPWGGPCDGPLRPQVSIPLTGSPLDSWISFGTACGIDCPEDDTQELLALVDRLRGDEENEEHEVLSLPGAADCAIAAVFSLRRPAHTRPKIAPPGPIARSTVFRC
jgi:hypothetical protein